MLLRPELQLLLLSSLPPRDPVLVLVPVQSEAQLPEVEVEERQFEVEQLQEEVLQRIQF